jgi:Sec-independent protein translocase protein TatA
LLPLAFLDVGPTEFLLVAALFLALFGADKVPQLAREVGKLSAQFRGAVKEVQDQIDLERGEAFRPGDAVPPDQKAQVQAAEEHALAQLRGAARSLGIDPAGKSEDELRAAIATKVGKAS